MTAPETPSAVPGVVLPCGCSIWVERGNMTWTECTLTAKLADLERRHEALVEGAEAAMNILSAPMDSDWPARIAQGRGCLRRALGAGK